MGDNQSNSENLLVLDQRLDLPAASALCAQLKEWRGKDLTIDANSVEHLGSQCLQTLLSAALTWRADNATLIYSQQSSAFKEALQNFGASSEALFAGGKN